MKLPFDISPLNPGNVVDYDIRKENGIEVAYLTYKDERSSINPLTWNVRLVLHSSDWPYKCSLCGNRYLSPKVTQCRVCGGSVSSTAPTEGIKQDKPKLKLRYYEKVNAKDKLVNIGGRACLILGTTEAVSTKSPLVHDVFLLSFYHFYQSSASVKYNVLQFFYYDSSSGEFFVDKKLNELNDFIWRETIEHNFTIVPQWNVAKICEIYLNRSV